MPDKMPISVAFKLLIKERDHYRNLYESSQDELKFLRREHDTLIVNYKESDWYKQKEEKMKEVENENKYLIGLLSGYMNKSKDETD